MKHVLVFLGLMTLAVRGIAQSQIPDMPFFISFLPLSGSPTNSEIWGLANYYRVEQPPPYLPNYPTYTNRLEVFINLPAPPKGAWVLEQEEDGSFITVMELTNYLTLTTNQIHSLIEGNWYAEVDFGESNYLGNLAPQYYAVNGPKVVMNFPPVIGDRVANGYTLISPNNHNAKFVFDGSHCEDPFYLPMQFFWTGWAGYVDAGTPVFTGKGMLETNVFELGPYLIRLQVNDSIVNGQPFYFYLSVITASEAVNLLISDIQNSVLTTNQRRIVIRVLSKAAVQFDKGHMAQGCSELEVYKILVKTLHFDSPLTHNLTQPAQDIISAFSFDDHKRGMD
jgi:hypothetical protein